MKKITSILLLALSQLSFSQQGAIDNTFNIGLGIGGNAVWDIAIQNDNKIIAVGNFDTFNGQTASKGVRINSNGSIDNTFNSGSLLTGQYPNKICIQSDGKILLGGQFFYFNGNGNLNLLRLNSDGTLNSNFTNVGFNGAINDMKILDNGKVLIAGDFTTPRNRIFVLNTDGTIDNTFSFGTNFPGIQSFLVQSDGKIIISSLSQVRRLNSDGSLDNTFSIATVTSTESTSYILLSCALQNDGKVLIGGRFTTVNGVEKNRIARLNNDGSIDSSFTGSGVDAQINTITVQSDSKIILGGDFTTYNSISKPRLVRLNNDGSIDSSFNVGLGASGLVTSSLIQGDGKLLIAGGFSSYDTTPINMIARINSTNLLENNEFTLNQNIEIYPNPTSGKFQIKSENEVDKIEIYNVLGELVSTENDLTNQKSGIYFLRLNYVGKVVLKKIIRL